MADVSGIAAKTTIFSKAPTKALDETTNALGQDAFLKLLVSQLRFQDPSEPVDNQQFMGQMAQFTNVEQLIKMNKSLDKLTSASTKTDAVAMLGAEVVIRPTGQAVKEGETPAEVTGTVTQIRFEGADTKLEVNGQEYSLVDVIKVRTPGR